MGAPYSTDLRQRVLDAYASGMQTAEIAQRFMVSRSWARRVKQRYRDFGEAGPRRPGSSPARKIDRARLRALVLEQPDATLAELRDRLGIQCELSSISKVLRAMGLTFKKRRSMRRSKSGPMSPRSEPSGRTGLSTLMPGG